MKEEVDKKIDRQFRIPITHPPLGNCVKTHPSSLCPNPSIRLNISLREGGLP